MSSPSRVRVSGPLVGHAAGFRADLEAQGYRRNVVANQLQLFAHVSRWLESKGLGPQHLTRERVLEFLAARRSAGYTLWLSEKGVAPLLTYLRSVGVAPAPEAPVAVASADRVLEEQAGKRPAALDIEDLNAPRISAFLDHLERSRGNTVRTRNARLAAIHSLFQFAALRHPEHAELIERVLAIPPKRFQRRILSFLTDDEVKALLAAPDRSSFLGRRDHALLVTAIQTGLRVTELIGLRVQDVVLGTGAHVRCLGKGRKERATPLTPQTAEVLRSWLKERSGAPPDPLFATSRGTPLSRYGVSAIVKRHAGAAAAFSPSLATKSTSPHVLRHTAAMRLLHAGVDTTVIALWLGHEGVETTQMYVHADLSLKEKALARITPIGAMPGRYHPPDKLLAFLEAL